MDQRFLRYYNQELKHVRETAAEFAKAFPKVAGRLGMETLEVGDPYIERLIESFAFLAARIQLKLDSRFPTFTQHLLQILYPSYQAPKPAMLVARVQPIENEPALAEGYTLPRHTLMRSKIGPNDRTACEFRTAQELKLWPLKLTDATYFSSDSRLASDGWGDDIGRARAGIRISLQATAGLSFQDIKLDTLPVYIAGPEELPVAVLEHVLADNLGFLVRAKGVKSQPPRLLPKSCIRAVGFDDRQALLPVPTRQFRGYRLIQEYFAFPQKFLFFELAGLSDFVAQCTSTEIEILILTNRSIAHFNNQIHRELFYLHCVPCINLIERQADRIIIKPGQHEYHVVVDKTRPFDFEVYSVEEVKGYSVGNQAAQRYLPYYGHIDASGSYDDVGYYVTRTEPRLLSSHQRSKGTRTSYIGSETSLSVVDPDSAPVNPDIKQLGIRVLCTNRDLSMTMPLGRSDTDFDVASGGPIEEVRTLVGPTKPRPAIAADESCWRLISLLSLNMGTLVCEDGDAVALRELLRLLGDTNDASIARQIDAVLTLKTRPCVRQMPVKDAITFGRGLKIDLGCDENGFEGLGVFLLGLVLNQFFGRYVSMNTFTELVLKSEQRDEIHRWPAQLGIKPLI